MRPDAVPISNSTVRNAALTGLKDLGRRSSRTYPINQCPQQCRGALHPNYILFETSHCTENGLAGDWSLECALPNWERYNDCGGRCGLSEYCLDVVTDVNLNDATAWCVAEYDLQKFTPVEAAHSTQSAQTQPSAQAS